MHDGYAVFAKGGNVLTLSSGERHACWWSGQDENETWGNRVQGIVADATTITNWWTSTGGVAPQLSAQPSRSRAPSASSRAGS